MDALDRSKTNMTTTIETTTEREITDLQFAIARAEDAAQDAEDGEQFARASKIRAQVRAMAAQIRALQTA